MLKLGFQHFQGDTMTLTENPAPAFPIPAPTPPPAPKVQKPEPTAQPIKPAPAPSQTLKKWSAPEGLPHLVLNVKEAAALVSLCPATLNDLRITGGGPKFKRLGRRVVYTIEDLKAWVEEHASFKSTTQADMK